MRRWFTSDEHFDHANIIALSGRPFVDAAEMGWALVNAWNEVVADDDEVWCLGDVCLGKLRESLAWVGLLAGRKILVPGNHDRVAAYHKKRPADSLYLYAGFVEIRHGPQQLRLDGGTAVLIDHFPYAGDSQGTQRYSAQRPADRGGWLLHGHVHEAWRQRGRMINVGVDAWAGRPVAEEDLAALIAEGPAERDPLPW